jgi:HlyD family secretion protein
VAQKSESPVALGAALLEIADPRSLEAVVDVLSQDAVAIRPGMAARLELGQGVAPLAARVRLVEPAAFTKISALGVEEQRVNVVLDFAEPLDRVQTVGDAFRVEAHIVVHQEKDVTKVPVGALFRDGEGWAVYVAEDGRAHKRAVKVPRRNGVEAMVEDGVKPGERVVVYPSDALKDGARLAPKKVSGTFSFLLSTVLDPHALARSCQDHQERRAAGMSTTCSTARTVNGGSSSTTATT